MCECVNGSGWAVVILCMRQSFFCEWGRTGCWSNMRAVTAVIKCFKAAFLGRNIRHSWWFLSFYSTRSLDWSPPTFFLTGPAASALINASKHIFLLALVLFPIIPAVLTHFPCLCFYYSFTLGLRGWLVPPDLSPCIK